MIGSTVSQYKLLDELGRSDIGVMYGARDTRLDRFVTLKLVLPEIQEEATDANT